MGSIDPQSDHSPGRGRFSPVSALAERVDAAFAATCDELLELLPGATVEHMGATSVPGAITKGDLDILVLINPAAFDGASGALAALFEIHQAENWTPSFASFNAPARDGIPIGIQLAAAGSLEERQFIGLRDLLRTRPDLLERLNNLKRSFDGADPEAYWRAKQELIESLLADNGLAGPAERGRV